MSLDNLKRIQFVLLKSKFPFESFISFIQFLKFQNLQLQLLLRYHPNRKEFKIQEFLKIYRHPFIELFNPSI